MPNVNSQDLSNSLLSWTRLAALVCISASFAFAQHAYSTFDAPGALYTFPGAINNNGVIAGVFLDFSFPNQYFGFIRAADGTFTVFDTPMACYNDMNAPCQAAITGINDLGQLVGYVNDEATGLVMDFMRDPNGSLQVLSGSPDVALWYPVGLTNTGETIAQASGLAYLRTSTGVFTPLPQPEGFTQSVFVGINNSGVLAGHGLTGTGSSVSDFVGFLLDLSSNKFTLFPTTIVQGLNDQGMAIGTILPDRQTFVAASDGSVLESFYPVVPEAAPGYDDPFGINQTGMIMGRFFDGDIWRGYIGVPSPDSTPPSISLLAVIPGPPQEAVFSVADGAAGLFSIDTSATNCVVTVSQFTPGQTSPATVTAAKIDQTQPATVEIVARNIVGLVSRFDPGFLTVYGTDGPKSDLLSGISPREHVLVITNGKPGIEKLHVNVNGRRLVVPLKDDEKRTLSLRTWMTLDSNTIGFWGEGLQNAQASLVLKDAAPGEPRTGRQRH